VTKNPFLYSFEKSVPVRNNVLCNCFGARTAVLDAIALEIAVQAGAPDAKDVRRPQTVPLAHLEHSLDMDFADFL
jgi:hypothetical protein